MDRNTEGLISSSEKLELRALAAMSEELALVRAAALQMLNRDAK
jgi:hypothetical protein